MGRTQLSPQRLSETKKTNIGRIIIFCEGKTEKYYFDYFAEIIKKNKLEHTKKIMFFHYKKIVENVQGDHFLSQYCYFYVQGV